MEAIDLDLSGLRDPATVTGLAKFLDSGDDGVRAAIRSGELEAVRINRRGDFRIFHTQIRKWIASKRTTTSIDVAQVGA